MDFSKIKLGDGAGAEDVKGSSSVGGSGSSSSGGSSDGVSVVGSTGNLRFGKLASARDGSSPSSVSVGDNTSNGASSDGSRGVSSSSGALKNSTRDKMLDSSLLGNGASDGSGGEPISNVSGGKVDVSSVGVRGASGGDDISAFNGGSNSSSVSALSGGLPRGGSFSGKVKEKDGGVVSKVSNPLLDGDDEVVDTSDKDGGNSDSLGGSSFSGGNSNRLSNGGLPVSRVSVSSSGGLPRGGSLVNPLLDDDDDFGEFSGDVEVVELEDDSAALLSNDDVKVLAEQKAYRDKRNSKYRFTDEDRVRKFSKSYVYRKPLSGRSSQMHVRGAVEYLVDDSGAFIYQGGERVRDREGFEALVKAAESNAGVRVGDAAINRSLNGGDVVVSAPKDYGKVIYPWSTNLEAKVISEGGRPAPGKLRLNDRELDFYRRLRETKKGVLSDEEIISELRAPVDSRIQLGDRSRKNVERKLGTAIKGGANFSRWAGTAINASDMDILQFLVRFRYANTGHIANLCGIKRESARKRMVKLRDKGLVEAVPLWGSGRLWLPTSAGAIISGYDLPIVKYSDLSHQLIPHQFAVNNIAANLWGGGVNVLDLVDFPSRNRFDVQGRPVFGEELVSETEMLSSFRKISWMQTSDVYRPVIRRNIEREFDSWLSDGGVNSGTMSPEFVHGNEYMWILYPPTTVVDKVYHVPDLVVKRPRNADGSPNSIAVELEAVEAKDRNKYLGVLKAYMADKSIFGKVIWVCKTIASANAIEDLSKEIGLWQEGRVNVVPILTDKGIFEGRDLWRLS